MYFQSYVLRYFVYVQKDSKFDISVIHFYSRKFRFLFEHTKDKLSMQIADWLLTLVFVVKATSSVMLYSFVSGDRNRVSYLAKITEHTICFSRFAVARYINKWHYLVPRYGTRRTCIPLAQDSRDYQVRHDCSCSSESPKQIILQCRYVDKINFNWTWYHRETNPYFPILRFVCWWTRSRIRSSTRKF